MRKREGEEKTTRVESGRQGETERDSEGERESREGEEGGRGRKRPASPTNSSTIGQVRVHVMAIEIPFAPT